MNTSGYICAGFETMGSFLDKFFAEKSLNECFDKETLNSFFLQTCNKFLHSFGASFSGRKKYDTYARQEAKLFKQNRDYGFFNDCLFYVDSGGFQASIGKINRKETDLLSSIYYDDFLVNHKDIYDRAFVLDIPPGPGCTIFSTFDDVYKMNHESYIFIILELQSFGKYTQELWMKIIYLTSSNIMRLVV
jgi:hypothetical protein